jgi:hypothetical protein
MWLPTRRWSTTFYLLMMIIVLVVALLKQNVGLVLFLLFIEYLAGIWYSLSYIPFARKVVCRQLRASQICFPCFWVSDKRKETCNTKSSGSSSSSFSTSSNTPTTTALFGGEKKSSSTFSSVFTGSNTK